MLNKFKPRYKTTKKIVDWEPTPDSKSRTRDRDKGKAGKGGNFWVKSLADGRTSSISENHHGASRPCDVATNEFGDTFHLFRQHKLNPNKPGYAVNGTSWVLYNTASDFCITKVNADGDKVWEKIYAFPSYAEDGAGLYISPDHDGVTAQFWDDIFSYRLPESFQHSENPTTERYKPNSLVYAEEHIYVCAKICTSDPYVENGRYNSEFQQIYPDNYVQGIYVIKIDASTGEVVDDSYTHIALTNYQTSDPKRGITFVDINGTDDEVPIFNYDPYQRKLIVLSKLRLEWLINGSNKEHPHRDSWGTMVSEIDVDTMQTTARYLNHQVHNYVFPNQTKNMIAFSPTHNFVVGRTMNAIHPEKVANNGNPYNTGDDDTAILKFDKNWNLLDRKQYGYPEKDDQGNYYDDSDKSLGYGELLTQGQSQLQIGQIFYSESKDKIYARSRRGLYGEFKTVINQYDHGQSFIDNVAGELDLSFSDTFRITEIEPSDLSVTSVKWPQWNGPEGPNQFPQSIAAYGFSGSPNNETYPTSMSPDGKYIYASLPRREGFAIGLHADQLLDSMSQHHYFSSPWKTGSPGSSIPHTEILRYNIETGRFDRSWVITNTQIQRTGNGYRGGKLGLNQGLLATKDGWVSTHSNDGFMVSTNHKLIEFSTVIGAKNADLTEREGWVGVTDSSRGEAESLTKIYEGAMVYQNGDLISTWEEPLGWMTANERFMWDEYAGYSGANWWNEGENFYTYYNSDQTLSERLNFFDQHVFPIHKIADVIGESHKAYDQDGWVDTVFRVRQKSTSMYVATSYKKPFYRGTAEGINPDWEGIPSDLALGGDGGFNDQVDLPQPFWGFVDSSGKNIDMNNQFSGSALLPPLPETDHHVFYSTNPELLWAELPTSDENPGIIGEGRLEKVDSTRSGIIGWSSGMWVDDLTGSTQAPQNHNTQTVYRYRAIFDWDATDAASWKNAEIVAVERFGLNSVTGKRNQIKTGHRAFEFVRPVCKDLMYYHGEPRLLQSEDHMWDVGGPGFRTLDTSNLTDMSYMFYDWGVLPVSGPTLSSWDTSNVTDMSFMFWSGYLSGDPYARLTIELGWDTSNVTNMESMLPRQSYVDARTWDFSNVVNINNFTSEQSLIFINNSATVPEIASWGDRVFECRDVKSYIQRCWPALTDYNILGYEDCVYWYPSSYTIMVANREITDSDLPMYGSANVPSDTELELIDQYEVSTRATRYVYKATFPWNNSANSVSLDWLENVTQFGGNRLEDGRNAFNNAPISTVTGFSNPRFTVSNLTNFDSMFSGCSNFIGDVTGWDTSNATSMASMFSGCAEFNDDITGWDVSNVQYMDSMFSGCSSFNQDISGWNTQNVISADSQFNQASSFNQDLSEWCVRGFASEPTDFSTGASSWTQPHPVWGTCPRNEDGLGQEFYHIFIANELDIWFPVPSDSDVRSVYVDDVLKDYATEVRGKIFNGSTIKAEFDWNNSSGRQMDWINQLVQIGYNSETGKTNQIKSGRYAFYYANISESDAIKNLDISNLNDFTYMFGYNRSQGTLDLSGWDTSSVTNLSNFCSYSQCNFVGIENWNVSSVTSMNRFAYSATLFNGDIGPWDVSGVTTFDSAFYGATNFNADISGWTPTSATDLDYMFRNAPNFNADISGWDVSSATRMYGMFYDADAFNQNISSWDVSNVTEMRYMFRYATSFNQDLSLWCVQRISSEPSYFSDGATSWVLPKPVWGTCPALATTFVANTPTLTWDMLPTNDADNGSLALISDNGDGTWTFEVDAFYDNSVVQRNLSWMVDVLEFKYDVWNNQAYSFNGSPATSITAISKNSIARATRGADLSYMFANMPNFNQDISIWDVSATTNMNGMFSGATSFNQDLSAWNTLAVTSMEDMFNGATSFNQDLYPWCVSLIASEPSGFATGATSWTLPKPAWGTCPRNEDGSAPDEFYHIFVANNYSINFPVPDDSKVGVCFVDGVQKDYITEIKGKFFDGSTIKASFDWDNEEPLYGDFYNYSLLWIKDLVQIGFNTETMSYNQIKNPLYAFYRMEFVEQSDAIANLDISNLTHLDNMFNRCYNFNTDISGWDTSNITSMLATFTRCSKFDQPIGSWDVSNVTTMESTFSRATVFNQDLSGWDTSSSTRMYYTFGEAQAFNQDISGWDTSKVTSMGYMFYRAYAFNQDLSLWCVSLISSQQSNFDGSATAWTEPRPVWGTCPRGEDGL